MKYMPKSAGSSLALWKSILWIFANMVPGSSQTLVSGFQPSLLIKFIEFSLQHVLLRNRQQGRKSLLDTRLIDAWGVVYDWLYIWDYTPQQEVCMGSKVYLYLPVQCISHQSMLGSLELHDNMTTKRNATEFNPVDTDWSRECFRPH